jgi:hypothetical protein
MSLSASHLEFFSENKIITVDHIKDNMGMFLSLEKPFILKSIINIQKKNS